MEGEGGGGGEVVGEGVRDLDGSGIVTSWVCSAVVACANSRDKEDGPAIGVEFARVRTGLNR